MPTDPRQNEVGDVVCEHGTAMDVHCCHCHSGFIFDATHECPPEPDAFHALKVAVMVCVSNPYLTWPEARTQLTRALNAALADTGGGRQTEQQSEGEVV